MQTETEHDDRYDVVVAGYGPTGMVLAALVAQQGHRVAILERYSGLYNLPRAATFDDETMRIFQKLGLGDVVEKGTSPRLVYDWCNGEGQVLDRHVFAARGLSGWPEFNMMYQPWLEDQLDALCRGMANLDVLHDHRVTDVRQDDDGAVVVVETPHGPKDVATRYVVACDGGNSTVRALLGIGSEEYGFVAPWLVCDFELKRSPEGLPTCLQWGDPALPVSIFTIDEKHQRFAFMLDDDAQLDSITEDDVWPMVSRWMSPEDATPIRIATYTFQSRAAHEWRRGRVLLAGDAAHEMPPFLGQGMCSGIRDSNNLAWKLDMVLSGAEQTLLDTYQTERAPHVRKITHRAIEMGKMQTIRDVEKARARDERMLKARAEAPETGESAGYAFPAYEDGFMTASRSGSGRGRLFPQGFARARDGRVARFDDLREVGFQVVAIDPSLLPVGRGAGVGVVDGLFLLTEDGAHGAGAGVADGVTTVADVDGVHRAWFTEHDCTAAVVRPDGYVYGTARRPDELSDVLADLGARVGAWVGRAAGAG